MCVLIGKEKCNQCNILKNVLDEKGIISFNPCGAGEFFLFLLF